MNRPSILFRGCDADAIDHVAAARHPPGEHTGHALLSGARNVAIQRDDAILNPDIYRADGIGRFAYRLQSSLIQDPDRA
jgi:hypothetical protein